MSVLKLRRDMVVVEEEAKDDPLVEIDRPFPLRKIEPETSDIIEGEITELSADHDHDYRPRKTFFQRVKFWFTAAVIAAVLGAYPAMVIAASDVGDRNLSSLVDRAKWSSPWAGGAATLMERHFEQLGWASDAQAWEPMARLSAKPAYQSAMAASLGQVIALANSHAVADGRADPDLEAATRLVNAASTGIQMRAARDALVNYDRRLRRHDVAVAASPKQLGEQLALINGWASASQTELLATAESIGGNPLDEDATRAVYAAKGRAVVAYVMLEALNWPQSPVAAEARAKALAAWKSVAEFHPLIVLNGDPDGSIFGNHPAAVGFLLVQAEAATKEFLAIIAPAKPATAAQDKPAAD
jgi:hypothetical protein